MTHYIGLMSGTSADGIDAVLVNFENNISIVDTEFLAYTKSTKATIQQLQIDSGVAYHELAQLDIELGLIAADIVTQLVGRNPDIQVTAIGSHGQTIQHRPNDTLAYTLQIGHGALLSEKTGITVVNNFRARDVATGGQGAPFAPLFHQAFFADIKLNRVIVNIGGIANLSYLGSDSNIVGFDTGPGNTLIDSICRKEFNQNYDNQGKWGQSGQADAELLQLLLQDPYFSQPPPKSTGQEYFNEKWLSKHLDDYHQNIEPLDLLTTVTQLTAESITGSISKFYPYFEEIYVCGGGAHNHTLINFLKQALDCDIKTTEVLGIHPDWVEACGFAWLAKQAMEKNPVDLTRITGSQRPSILGSIWLHS